VRRVVASASVAVLFLACEEKAKPTLAPQSRSQAVVAAGPPPVPAPMPTPPPAAAGSAKPSQHPILCAQQLGKPAKDAPKAALSRAGESTLSEKLPVGPGHWTWVNLWAAWCVPCREEIPRLKSWETKTAGERVSLKLAFISLDDDGRQLETFLGQQPPTGLKATYWLTDGSQRKTWLEEVGMKDEPELPAHFLIDPAGKVRCKQQGAIDDADFAEVLKILRGERGGAGAGQNAEGTHGNPH